MFPDFLSEKLSASDRVVLPTDSKLHQLRRDFELGLFEQLQSSITEDLRRTLPNHADPGESEAILSSEYRRERILEGNHFPHSRGWDCWRRQQRSAHHCPRAIGSWKF